jgi:tetratricopeptide (TPR) repeat protein
MKKKGKPRPKGQKTTIVAPKNPKPASGIFNHWRLTAVAGTLVLITAIAFFPMLFNEFTNWDDEYYVINNELLRGPDWKGIFTQPVVGNYHPLTILSLALNYAISALTPFSYLFLNYLLHLINTLLVFYFILQISGKKAGVAAFTAILFGIHPMHVESVAWISERKDVLYALFFIWALIQYWKYLETGRIKYFWFTLLLFVLSLLSKPAAVILPLVLLLLDYYKGRRLDWKPVSEKWMFWILSVFMGVLTVKIQAPDALASLDVFPLWLRFFFACYVLMIYVVRFFIPYPLSTFHPYPPASDPGIFVLLSPLFIILLAVLLWHQRKNKDPVFGILFFIINLLLVLQILSIGLTIVSERYTYIPYIGLAFSLAMTASRIRRVQNKLFWVAAAIFILALSVAAFFQTKVWRNSETLWTNALKFAPDAPYALSNRANYLSKLALRTEDPEKKKAIYEMAFEDCRRALAVKPNFDKALETRGLMYLDLGQNQAALADADSLIKYTPRNKMGYDIRGSAYSRFGDLEKALADFQKCIELDPKHHRAISNRGTILLHQFQKYEEALADFNRAISIKPLGSYYLNRSICYYKMGNIQMARTDALKAREAGATIPENYKSLLQLQ